MNIKLSRRARILLLCAAGAIVVLFIAAFVLSSRLEPWARATLIQALRERYKADVELGDLKISLLPSVRVRGEGLVVRLHDGPTMLSIGHFTASASFFGLMRSPRHIGRLTLEALEVTVPRRGSKSGTGEKGGGQKISIVIDEVKADGTRLKTTPKDPSKTPLLFDLRKLTLHRVGGQDAMSYHAELTNPKPPGLIEADGSFGPWNADEPTDSPVAGKYTFDNADLSVFKGIRGILKSQGRFKGHLDSIEVQGTADVPKFALRIAGHEMPLHTTFQATVDGTDGDTILHPVKARLGESEFEVTGAIDRGALEQHKTILLQATGDGARLEDFLRLAMKSSTPPMTGQIRFQSIIKIPPGDKDVIERLELDGAFGLDGVRFTSPDVEEKISSLSHRAEGDPENKASGVTAALSGHFKLHNGTMHLPDIAFRLPGALITLAGTYEMQGGALDFDGTARLDATVSQMTTGIKSILLKPVDPLFKRSGAGAVVPIKISGTQGQPSFSLDIGRTLLRK